MKTKSIFLILVLAVLLPAASNAQQWILRRAIDRKIEHKVDSAVDKSDRDEAAKARGNEKKSDSTATTAKTGTKETGRGLFGGKIDIKYDDEYKFTGRIYMQMETYDKKDVLKSDYYTYFSNNSMTAGIDMMPVDVKEGNKAVPTTFLFDGNNRCFLMLLQSDSKTGMISTIPSDSAMAAQTKNQKANPEKAVITKTGNSRVIAGYKCDEYKIVDPEKDGYSNVWMTKDIKLKADKKYWGKAGVPTYYNYPGFEGAMMLAMEAFDKNNKPTMKMETKEIKEDFSHSISTVGYTFMKMNFGQAGKK
jgi:poly-gamma-glutamate capsule biosynthesis protein CapA/YwtB (metallophosphatase superfamily)